MKHYLNVCDVNGAEVEPVDAITFGSPCQDLSVAGKRAGLKHESNGDDETTRSGLFMEAVRIIKEMREKDGFEKLRSGRTDEHIRPRFAVWENVPGAFSSNKGEDFRVVLEELARIKDTEVSIPLPEKGKWKQSGEIVGDGWSIAWRTLDAQYHGVPQRRRRIFLIADFADECAGEILFECKGLPGYPSESSEKGQGIAGDFAEGIRGTGERECIGFDGYNQAVTGDVSKAITSAATDADHVPLVFEKNEVVPYTLKIRSGCEGGGKGALIQTDKSATLAVAQDQTLFQPIVCLEGNGARPSHLGNGYKETDKMYTLNTAEVHAVAYAQQAIGEFKDCDCASTLKSRDYKGATDLVCEPIFFDGYNQEITENATQTLTCQRVDVSNIPLVAELTKMPPIALHDPSCAIDASYFKGPGERNGIERNIVAQPVFALDRAAFNQGENAQYDFQINDDGIAQTLVAKGPGAVSYYENIKYIVRRLTPTECARLQGMPDAWCRLSQIEDMSDEDYEFWKQAHKTYSEVNGKTYKEKTKTQMIAWYNKLQADSSEYKAYGNGMALPCVRVPIHGIAKHGAKTMASLFDGIGGFPLAGLIDGIQTLWTSEIELFPIAVTMERFREFEKYGCFTFGYEGSNANLLIEKEKKTMELKINEVQLPEQITFNYEELKQELQEKVSLYETLVYTDEQIKEAKADKANLNKLKKALNDERIRREREYMEPFNDFKAKINEIIGIIDKPVAVIDKQVKEFEEKQKQEKLAKIKDYYCHIEEPDLHWLELPAIYDAKWLNASVSMKSIQEEITARLEQIKNDLATLSDLPEFGFEATEVYKTTLDLNKALNEGRRLSEIQKRKAEYEAEQARLAAEKEAQNIREEESVIAGTVTAEVNVDGQTVPVAEIPVKAPAKQWISFSALLSTEDALALNNFFNSRNIEFKAV